MTTTTPSHDTMRFALLAAFTWAALADTARADWASEIAADNPVHWWRFETLATATPITNEGSTAGFAGVLGPGIVDTDLGQASATPDLGYAMEFSGPPASAETGKYVDFGASVPELINERPPTVSKSTTVEFWIRTTHSGSHFTETWRSPAVLGRQTDAGGMFWGTFNGSGEFGMSTTWELEIFDQRDAGPAARVADGAWHHVMLIKTWETNRPCRSQLIVDGGAHAAGFRIDRLTSSEESSYQEAGGGIRFLGFNEGTYTTNAQFVGHLDELVIYDRALSETEARRHYYAAFPDADGDGLPDNYEGQHGFTNGVDDSAGDPDGDGLANAAEFIRGTNPFNRDSDGDGLPDSVETATGIWVGPSDRGSDPLDADSDDDGLDDAVESGSGVFAAMDDVGTDPNQRDSDGDGYDDRRELDYGVDPNSAALTPQLAPVYNAASNAWVWRIDSFQIVWDHGSGIRDESLWGDRWIFSIDAANASDPGRPSVSVGGRVEQGNLAVVFGAGSGALLTTSSWYSDWNNPPADLTSAFGFSGFGRRDVSDRLQLVVVAQGGPGGPTDWTLSFALNNLDTGAAIGTYVDTGTAVDSIHQGTALWDWWDRETGEINLHAHQGGKVWALAAPIGANDSDDDGMDDSVELAYFGDLDQTQFTDWDGDGVTDVYELEIGSNPLLADSDGDGADDAYELSQGSNPTDATNLPTLFTTAPPGNGEDLNGNGMSDVWEAWVGSFTLDAAVDSDNDGMRNDAEAVAGTDPLDAADYLDVDIRGTGTNIVVAWQPVPYKRYWIDAATGPADWDEATAHGPFDPTATGTMNCAVGSPATNDAPGFYRARVSGPDTDGDGVDDWSEAALGSTVAGGDPASSRNSLRQPVTNALGQTLDGDYVAMVEWLQGATTGGSPTGEVTATQASRFLTQATFGPTMDDIHHLMNIGFDAWISEQVAMPPYLHQPYIDAIWEDLIGPQSDPTYNRSEDEDSPFLFGNNVTTPFLRAATQSPDQLRQRVAFALSQILVASRRDAELNDRAQAIANYYDIFVRNAFGNYEDILLEVTFHPVMGRYLSHIGNQLPDPDILRFPDENYAREIMQLFSIGLWELNPDGSRILAGGEPVATYGNREITEFARVFTGFWYARHAWGSGGWMEPDYLSPMDLHAAEHDFGEKVLFLDRALPGRPEITIAARAATTSNADQDIRDAINALFMHPNTPPFICRQLIQFLVTANPSAGYVQRVQDVFVDNGSGVRGDLASVVRAILLDDEARNTGAAALTPSFGKLKEPVLRTTQLARAFRLGRHTDLVWWNWGEYAEQTLQEPMLSPSVFNFFRPDYQAPALVDDGLVSPVFQITDSYTSISVPNLLWSLLTDGFTAGSQWSFPLDYTDEQVLADNPAALADRMNLLFCQGTMTALTRTELIAAVDAIPAATPGARVIVAAYVAMGSPDGAVQR